MKKTFKQLWRELCKQGWTPKPSAGLSSDHRYVRLGRSVKGNDGIDYFTGEKALLEFARQRGWLEYSVIAGTIPSSPSSTALTAPPADSGVCDDSPTSAAADRVERETAPTTTPRSKENVPATTISTATATPVASTTQARASSPVTSTNTAQDRPATAQVRTASVATRDATVQALTAFCYSGFYSTSFKRYPV
ncbi:hypothetical protein DVH05_019094 [Phytophthora capsici]|nr:hypothetical protein DVH05_019094 [Phytophthora capsici]